MGQLALGRLGPQGGNRRRVRHQVQIENQSHVRAADEAAGFAQPPRSQLEHPRRHLPHLRVPEGAVSRIAPDPHNQRSVSAHVQERQNPFEWHELTLVERQRPVLGRDPQEGTGNTRAAEVGEIVTSAWRSLTCCEAGLRARRLAASAFDWVLAAARVTPSWSGRASSTTMATNVAAAAVPTIAIATETSRLIPRSRMGLRIGRPSAGTRATAGP